VLDQVEVIHLQKVAILNAVQTSMIQRLAFEGPDRFAVLCSASKHESRAGKAEAAEGLKHQALIFGLEVEETVPRDQAMERTQRRQAAHIGGEPGMLREVFARDIDHCGSTIHASDATIVVDKVLRNRLA
jgi:hypothetical protein